MSRVIEHSEHSYPVGGDPLGGADSLALIEPPTVRPAAQRSRGVRVVAAVVPPLVLAGCLVGVWFFAHHVWLSARRKFLIPPPTKVVRESYLKWDNTSTILEGLVSTVRVAAIGLSISIALGIAIAVLMSQSKLIERAVFPLMVVVQATPILALTPIIAIVLGTNQTSRVLVCVLITIFPITLNTLYGLVSAEGGLHDLVTLHHGGRLTRLRKVMFPAALPLLFAGLRIAAGLSVIGAIVGDFFFGRGDVGLGQLMKRYSLNTNEIPLLYGTTLVAAALGVTVFLSFGALQNAVIGKWHDSRSGGGH